MLLPLTRIDDNERVFINPLNVVMVEPSPKGCLLTLDLKDDQGINKTADVFGVPSAMAESINLHAKRD